MNGVSQEWEVSSTGCDAANGPVRAVSACYAGGCAAGGEPHSSQYELMVDLEGRRGAVRGHQRRGDGLRRL